MKVTGFLPRKRPCFDVHVKSDSLGESLGTKPQNRDVTFHPYPDQPRPLQGYLVFSSYLAEAYRSMNAGSAMNINS